MFDQIARALRRPWIKGLLSTLLVCAFLLCSICHAESPSAKASPGHGTHTAAESAESGGAGPTGAHEHAGDHHCDDSDVLRADHRTGAVKLLMLLALGAALIPAVWAASPQVGTWSRLLRRRLIPRSGTQLLLSLCIIRV
ncbi:hypothetical protein HDA32_004616 [Spinactinospora alkalitolerans]|uniref:Uncharacterized protein n=1 Tax=Spinactinospora alkalitolerans TaxID=687207 RepID=A0A852TY79_9ACTN|nr:hypothetical protein [Spinactinospora alkalitolerans]NYE49496.1 hypothetical protein [Spinactinospora alkalitolerans]